MNMLLINTEEMVEALCGIKSGCWVLWDESENTIKKRFKGFVKTINGETVQCPIFFDYPNAFRYYDVDTYGGPLFDNEE